MRTTPLVTPLLALVLTASAASAQGAPAPAPAAARPAPPAALPADSFDLARKYTQWFYDQQLDSLIAHHSAQIRNRPELAPQLASSFKSLTEHAGKEIWVTDERFITRNGQRQYWRTANYTGFDQPVLFRLVMNAKGELTGIGFGPKADAPPVDPAP
jgi:hypothetical protein